MCLALSLVQPHGFFSGAGIHRGSRFERKRERNVAEILANKKHCFDACVKH
jgi:hypothetical protein